MDFNKIPRFFTDQISMNHSDKIFNVGFRSGEDFFGFALLPEAAKVMSKMLAEQVKSYETKNGKIDISKTEGGIESPIQLG